MASMTTRGRQPLPRNTPEPQAVYGARWVPLTRGAFALVDAEDYERVIRAGSWSLSDKGYALRNISSGGRETVFLHHEVLRVRADRRRRRVDHKNGNPLDCRKTNLRPATQQQNMMNKAAQSIRRAHNDLAGIKGVFRTKPGRFKVQIGYNDETHHIGVFDTLGEAIKMYNTAARTLFGEYARLNTEDEKVIAELQAKVPLPPPRVHREWGSKYERIAEKLARLKQIAEARR